jgi:uncharacterized membrane protein HdeD (DUF308 family)
MAAVAFPAFIIKAAHLDTNRRINKIINKIESSENSNDDNSLIHSCLSLKCARGPVGSHGEEDRTLCQVSSMDACATNRHRCCFYCTLVSGDSIPWASNRDGCTGCVSIILVMLGVEQIIGGIFHYKNQRAAHVGIGILIIALAIAAIAFPVFFAALVIITLAAVALLFSGISSILAGVGHKKDPIWSRGANVGVGALAVVISGIALISLIFGVLLVALMIAIALLVYGMRLILSGVSPGGRRQTMTPTASPTDTTAAA